MPLVELPKGESGSVLFSVNPNYIAMSFSQTLHMPHQSNSVMLWNLYSAYKTQNNDRFEYFTALVSLYLKKMQAIETVRINLNELSLIWEYFKILKQANLCTVGELRDAVKNKDPKIAELNFTAEQLTHLIFTTSTPYGTFGLSALNMALWYGNLEAWRLFTSDAQVQPKFLPPYDLSSLHHLATQSEITEEHYACLDYLKEKNYAFECIAPDPEQRNVQVTPLALGVNHLNVKFIELMLAKGANVNATDSQGNSILARWFIKHAAQTTPVKKLALDVLTILLRNGANLAASLNQTSHHDNNNSNNQSTILTAIKANDIRYLPVIKIILQNAKPDIVETLTASLKALGYTDDLIQSLHKAPEVKKENSKKRSLEEGSSESMYWKKATIDTSDMPALEPIPTNNNSSPTQLKQ